MAISVMIIPAGYAGDLWIELIPRSFDVVVAVGVRLTQMICFNDRDIIDHASLLAMHAQSRWYFIRMARRVGFLALDAWVC